MVVGSLSCDTLVAHGFNFNISSLSAASFNFSHTLQTPPSESTREFAVALCAETATECVANNNLQVAATAPVAVCEKTTITNQNSGKEVLAFVRPWALPINASAMENDFNALALQVRSDGKAFSMLLPGLSWGEEPVMNLAVNISFSCPTASLSARSFSDLGNPVINFNTSTDSLLQMEWITSAACGARNGNIGSEPDSFSTAVIFRQRPSETTREDELLTQEFAKDATIPSIRDQILAAGLAESAEIVDITLKNYSSVIDNLAKRVNKNREHIIVVNLCDGTEEDGYPGASVVKALHDSGLQFTGSSLEFYQISTSKLMTKKKLQDAGVPTSEFVEIIPGKEEEGVREAAANIGWPLFVKPDSINSKSIVTNIAEALNQIAYVHHLTQGKTKVFLEKYLDGREFTVLVVSNANGVTVYPPVERVFLDPQTQFLAFDKYWAGYSLDDKQTSVAETSAMYEYAPVSQNELAEDITAIARRAYVACNGSGYGRVDIRTKKALSDASSAIGIDVAASIDGCRSQAFVLEVNAQCGFTFERGSSSMAEILALARIPPQAVLREVFAYARRGRGSGGDATAENPK
ncbi:hypothetical protein HDU82_003066 [Entophlyctis luteolus]|nr:hypothetical protein HDU82_003066 [Entophlyctis luteolus]